RIFSFRGQDLVVSIDQVPILRRNWFIAGRSHLSEQVFLHPAAERDCNSSQQAMIGNRNSVSAAVFSWPGPIARRIGIPACLAHFFLQLKAKVVVDACFLE